VNNKILAEVIANRVKSALESVIHPDQTCAVPGRKISDSLALLRDTIAYVQDRQVDTCPISLDQEKAFDRISHTYMMEVSPKWALGRVSAIGSDCSTQTSVTQSQSMGGNQIAFRSGLESGRAVLSPPSFLCVELNPIPSPSGRTQALKGSRSPAAEARR